MASTAGALMGSDIGIATALHDQDRPRISFDGTSYFVAWDDFRKGTGYEIYGQRVTTSGLLLGSEFGIVTTGEYTDVSQVLFNGDNRYLVLFNNEDPIDRPIDSWDVYGQFVATTGSLS